MRVIGEARPLAAGASRQEIEDIGLDKGIMFPMMKPYELEPSRTKCERVIAIDVAIIAVRLRQIGPASPLAVGFNPRVAEMLGVPVRIIAED